MATPTKLPDKPVTEKPAEGLQAGSLATWHVPDLRKWRPLLALAIVLLVVIAWFMGYYVRGAHAQAVEGTPPPVKEEPPARTGPEIAEEIIGRGLLLPDRLAIWLFGKDDKVKVEILEKGEVQDSRCELVCQVTAASRTEPLAMAALIVVQYRRVKSRWYIQDLALLTAEVEDRRPPKKDTDKPDKPDKPDK